MLTSTWYTVIFTLASLHKMVKLPLYFMRFPQEIKGKYYQTTKPAWCMTMDTPEWPVAYCFNKTNDKIVIYIWWVPKRKYDLTFHDYLVWAGDSN